MKQIVAVALIAVAVWTFWNLESSFSADRQRFDQACAAKGGTVKVTSSFIGVRFGFPSVIRDCVS